MNTQPKPHRHVCYGQTQEAAWGWTGIRRPLEADGGDVCLVQHRPPWLYLAVADIAGKGKEPARWAEHLQAALRQALDRDTNAQSILQAVRRAMGPRLAEEDIFITLALAVVNLEDGAFTYANAGHAAAYLLRAQGPQVERLPATEVPLGVPLNGAPGQEHQGRFEPGDVLWLYSDGATEIIDASGHIFGRSGLLDVLLAAREAPLPAQVQAVLRALGLHRGAQPFPDDLTLLVLRRSPQQPALEGFPFVIQARYLHVRAATQRVLRQMRLWARRYNLDLPDTFFFRWELAVSEILTNIVQHAYNHQPERIQGMLLLFPDAMVLDVWDAGAPFQGDLAVYLNRPDPFPREKGYGLYLVHQSVDQVRYHRLLERNWWRLRKAFPQPISA